MRTDRSVANLKEQSNSKVVPITESMKEMGEEKIRGVAKDSQAKNP